jgi:hypothetical protein
MTDPSAHPRDVSDALKIACVGVNGGGIMGNSSLGIGALAVGNGRRWS